jgi:hypothetical protein
MCFYLSFLSDGLQTFWFGRNHEKERYFLRVMKMHKTVEGQTDSLLKDWAILSIPLTQGLPSGTTKLSVFKKKGAKLFHWKK